MVGIYPIKYDRVILLWISHYDPLSRHRQPTSLNLSQPSVTTVNHRKPSSPTYQSYLNMFNELKSLSPSSQLEKTPWRALRRPCPACTSVAFQWESLGLADVNLDESWHAIETMESYYLICYAHIFSLKFRISYYILLSTSQIWAYSWREFHRSGNKIPSLRACDVVVGNSLEELQDRANGVAVSGHEDRLTALERRSNGFLPKRHHSGLGVSEVLCCLKTMGRVLLSLKGE